MKSSYFEYLNSLSKEELVELVYKPFNNTRSFPPISKRTVALRLSYDGKNFKGVQKHRNIRSISDSLQNALELTGIGSSPVFCGRTDAGVSAISMIVSVGVNSRLQEPNRSYFIVDSDYNEYPYDVILNSMLPLDLRVTGWAPVPDRFNARYDCIQRHYKYFFILNDLDLERMKYAASKVLELNDFYHLSSHSNPKAIYKRKLDELTITKVQTIDFDLRLLDLKLAGNDIETTNANLPAENKKSIQLDDKQDNIPEGIENTRKEKTYGNPLSCLNIGENKENESRKKAEKTKKKQFNYKNRELYARNDVYCLDIKACGFLHNMVRKIFWAIESYGKGNELQLKNVEIADAEPLVFVGAKYPNKLEFMGNRHNEYQFKKENDLGIIQATIAQLRYLNFDM